MANYLVTVSVPALYSVVVEADTDEEAIMKVADSGDATLPHIGEMWSGDDDPDWDNATAEVTDQEVDE